MAKINGIKGVKISRDEFKNSDSSNSFSEKSSSKQNLDEAMMQMLLGQVRYLNAKADQIEANMKAAEKKEEERQQKEAEYRAKKEEQEREKEKREAENRVKNFTNNSLTKQGINLGLAATLGPAGLALGWLFNKGSDGLLDKGFNKLLGATGLFNKRKRDNNSGIGSWYGGNYSQNGDSGALDVNRREIAQEPINRLNATVSSGFKQVIELMGGKWRGGANDGGENSGGGFLSNLLGGITGGLLGGLIPRLLKKTGGFLLKRVLPIAAIGYLGYKGIDWALDKREEDKEIDPEYADAKFMATMKAEGMGMSALGTGLTKAGGALPKQGALTSKLTNAKASGLNKLAGSGKVGGFMFGKVAEKATKAARAANIAAAAGKNTTAATTLLKAGKLAKIGGKVLGPLGYALDAGLNIHEGHQLAKETGDEGKIYEGYGKAAGGVGGALAGIAAGAAIGSVVPVVGTIIGGIGGLVGGLLGGWGGEKIGKYGGRAVYDLTHDTEEPESEEQYNYSTIAPQTINNNEETQELLSQMLQTLQSMEANTRPEIIQELDNRYVNNIEKALNNTPPEVINSDYNYGEINLMNINPLGE